MPTNTNLTLRLKAQHRPVRSGASAKLLGGIIRRAKGARAQSLADR